MVIAINIDFESLCTYKNVARAGPLPAQMKYLFIRSPKRIRTCLQADDELEMWAPAGILDFALFYNSQREVEECPSGARNVGEGIFSTTDYRIIIIIPVLVILQNIP